MRCLALLFALLIAPPPALAETDEALDLLQDVNAIRREHGLLPLRFEENLSRQAKDFAQELADLGDLSHQGSKGKGLKARLESQGYDFRLAAENLASGQIGPGETVRLWMESPGHRRNILLPDVREAGIGKWLARDGQAYWTLLLGRRMADRADQPDYETGP
jgi:uncharacterized protein YkwD